MLIWRVIVLLPNDLKIAQTLSQCFVIKFLKLAIDDDHRSAPRAPSPLIYSRGPIMTSYTVVVAGFALMTSAKIVIGYCII